MKYALFVLLVILITCPNVLQASSVTKTVGVGQDYTTIGDALAAVNSLGLADTVSLALMDTIYTESPLMYNPTMPQPVALYMYQAGPAKPHIQVNAGGLPFGMMITNRSEFVLYNVLLEPSTSTTWMAGVSVRSMDEDSKVYIQSGGVTGSTTERGYEVIADSSSDVHVFGCLVINVQTVGIYIELQEFPPLSATSPKSNRITSGTGNIRIDSNSIIGPTVGIQTAKGIASKAKWFNPDWKANIISGADTGIVVTGLLAQRMDMSNNTFTNCTMAMSVRDCSPDSLFIENNSGNGAFAQTVSTSSTTRYVELLIVNDPGRYISVKDNDFSSGTGTGTALSVTRLGGTGSTLNSTGNIFSGFEYGTYLDTLGDMANIYINGAADTVATSAIYMPNGHNVSVFHVGSSSTASVLRTRYRVVSLEKMLSAKLGKQISATTNNSAIDVTINNDSTVLCDFSISNTDFDWIGTAITGNKKFLGNSTISGNTFSVIGYSSLPVMAITTSSAGIEQVSYDDSYNGNIGTHEMGHNWLSIELDNESGNPIFGPITISGNTIPGATTAMQLRAKRAELPTNVEKVTIVDNTFTGNSAYEGIAFELGDINIKNGVRFDSNRVSNTNVAFQYRAKRAEVQPNLNGIKTAELSHNTIDNVQTGFSFVFDPDSAAQAIAGIPFFEPIDFSHNVINNTNGIPNFVCMQLRSKRSELPTNVDAIKTASCTINGGSRGGLALFDIDPSIHLETMETDSNTVSNFAVINVPRTSLAARIKSMRVVHNTFENINSAEWNLESEFVKIENNTFTCSNSGIPLSLMAGRKYELQVRASSRQQIASSSFLPSLGLLLGGNSFCDGDLVVTVLNDDTAATAYTTDILNNQTNGNVTIHTYDTETDISGNTFGSSSATTSSHTNDVMAINRYELQVRSSNRVRLASNQLSATSSLLNFANNSLAGFADVLISIDDTSGTGSVQMDSNTVNGTTSLTNSSMAGNRYEVSFKKSKSVSLATNNSSNVGTSSFDYTNNTVSGYPDVSVSLDDSSETLSASITGNTFTNNAIASTSSMPANRYEVSFKKSKTITLAINNSTNVGTSSFDYTNNTVSGYPDVSVNLDDSSETLSASITGNTFTNSTNASTSSMPANRYEVSFKKSKAVTLTSGTSLSISTSSFVYDSNSVSGYSNVAFDLDDETGAQSSSLSGNTFAAVGSVTGLHASEAMWGNKLEINIRRGSRINLLSSMSKGTLAPVTGEWFVFENNAVSGFYDGGLFDVENNGDAGTVRLEGNSFSALHTATSSPKTENTMMPVGKYELNVRRANRTKLVSLNSPLSVGDSLIVRNNTFSDLDGGGFFLNTENNSTGDTLNVWLDGNTLSSSSAPFRFNLYESESDSGYTKFLETANVINGGTSSSNVIDGRYNILLGAMFASSSAKQQPHISTSPNSFSNGGGLQFTGSPLDTIQLNFQNIFGNTMNVVNATNNVVDARYCWWGTTDSADIASKMQGNVLFMPFLTDSVVSTIGSIVGRVYLDADASYSYDSGEMLLQGQEVTLWQNNSQVGADTTDVSGTYSFSNLALGIYTVMLTPLNGYVGTENDGSVVVDFVNGNSPIENFGIYQELQRFRTFKADTLLTKKPVKMAFKNGVLTSAYPNTVTALENVFARLGKNGATFLGVPQSNKNRAKLFAWVAYTKAADLGKLYLSAHTGTSYPIDSLRPAGKKAKFLKGALKADRKTYNNVAWEQGVAFNLNVIASALGVTPQGFGDLVVDSSIMLGGRDLQGMTLAEVSDWMNSLMTYWDSLGVDNSTAYAELGSFASTFLKRLNDGFAAGVTAGNSTIDTAAVLVDDIYIPGTKKNPYAVTLQGVATASSVGLVKYVPGNTPAVVIQDAGYSEEAEVPTSFGLQQNYPNPFNPSTVISYSLPVDGMITLKIYDLLGREVATVLQNEAMETGNYQTTFNATSLTSGVYFYRINVESVDEDGIQHTFTDVKRMMLIK